MVNKDEYNTVILRYVMARDLTDLFCNSIKAINPFITNPFYSRGTVSVGCGPTPTSL